MYSESVAKIARSSHKSMRGHARGKRMVRVELLSDEEGER
jgi:hypothetical protein